MSNSSCNDVSINSDSFTRSYSRFFSWLLLLLIRVIKPSWILHLLAPHHLVYKYSFQNSDGKVTCSSSSFGSFGYQYAFQSAKTKPDSVHESCVGPTTSRISFYGDKSFTKGNAAAVRLSKTGDEVGDDLRRRSQKVRGLCTMCCPSGLWTIAAYVLDR